MLRFEAPLHAVEDADASEAIRVATRAYKRALELLIARRPRTMVVGALAVEALVVTQARAVSCYLGVAPGQ